MNDLECPYCGKEQESPDCEGMTPDTQHEIECQNDDCGKTFGYTVEYDPSFTAYELPCANGEEHKYEKINGIPRWHFANRRRCKYCGGEITIKAGEPEYVDIEKDPDYIKFKNVSI